MKKLIFASLLMLSACDQVPLGTRAALQNLDVMTTDVTAMRFSVVLSPDIPIQSSATLTIAMETPEGVVSETFELSSLSEPLSTDNQVRNIFAIADSDHAHFNVMRTNMRVLKEKYPDDSKGSVSVSASGCLTGAAPDGPMLVSVFIGLEDEAAWLPLLRDADLRILEASADGEAMQPCTV